MGVWHEGAFAVRYDSDRTAVLGLDLTEWNACSSCGVDKPLDDYLDCDKCTMEMTQTTTVEELQEMLKAVGSLWGDVAMKE